MAVSRIILYTALRVSPSRHQGPLDPSPHIKPYPTPIIDLRSGLVCALIDRQALTSVNCALNKGAVLLCSCSYAGSPCEIASRLPSVRIYHASDGPLRPRANQHIRFGLRSSSRSLASSPRCALCVQRRPQLLAGSRRRGRCPPEKPRRGGRCGSCFGYLRNGQVPMVAVLYNSWLFLWWFETEPRLPARCPL